jgi:hypothetical protein
VPTRKDAGHKIQHVGRGFFVVPEVPDEPAFHNVDFLLSFAINEPGD